MLNINERLIDKSNPEVIRKFLVGDSMTLADIAIGAFIMRFVHNNLKSDQNHGETFRKALAEKVPRVS